jgi:hypothetical protein
VVRQQVAVGIAIPSEGEFGNANGTAARQHVQVEEAFMPVVAPYRLEATRATHDDWTEEESLFAKADVHKAEDRTIADAAFRLQVDDM